MISLKCEIIIVGLIAIAPVIYTLGNVIIGG